MITTRIFGKKVTGKTMYQCLVKAVGFFPKVDNLKPLPSSMFFFTLSLGSGGKSFALTFLGLIALHADCVKRITIEKIIIICRE